VETTPNLNALYVLLIDDDELEAWMNEIDEQDPNDKQEFR